MLHTIIVGFVAFGLRYQSSTMTTDQQPSITFWILAVAATVFALSKIVKNVQKTLHNRRFAKLHGCKPPFHRFGGPFGIIHFGRLVNSSFTNLTVQLLSSKYKPGRYTHSLNLLGDYIIQTIDPINIKSLLATPGIADFSLGKARTTGFNELLGEGIFTLDSGNGWEHSRAMLRPQFARKQVSDVNMLEKHISNLLDLMAKNEDNINLQPLLFKFTLDSATEFLFGESAGSLTGGVDGGEFADAFTTAQAFALWNLRMGGFFSHWWRSKRMIKANKIVHSFVDGCVEKALGRVREEKEKDGNPESGRYIFLDAVARETSDPKVLRDQMLNILLAGRDTTAGLFGWTFYLLARHPRVYKKLRDDLEAAFGTGEQGVWKQPTFDGLKDIPYLRHVLSEVLRLYPSVPFNGREAIRDTVLPIGGGPDGKSPVMVPAGTRVQYSVFALHRREDIYGSDVLEFRPERWAENPLLGAGWGYLPFNGGPRMCLGQQYALTEVGFTVARVLQRYETMEAIFPNEEVQIDATLTMSPSKCEVRVKRAK